MWAKRVLCIDIVTNDTMIHTYQRLVNFKFEVYIRFALCCQYLFEAFLTNFDFIHIFLQDNLTVFVFFNVIRFDSRH